MFGIISFHLVSAIPALDFDLFTLPKVLDWTPMKDRRRDIQLKTTVLYCEV